MNENEGILNLTALIVVPKGPNNNLPSLIPVMALCQTGNKPLSEPMTAQVTDTYMHLDDLAAFLLRGNRVKHQTYV